VRYQRHFRRSHGRSKLVPRCLWVTLGLLAIHSYSPQAVAHNLFQARPQSRMSVDNGELTISDLVTRTRFVLGEMAPDGHHAAFLAVHGDPDSDRYVVSTVLVDTQTGKREQLTEYTLTPDRTYTELEWLVSGAADLQWFDSRQLLYLTNNGEKMQLRIWDIASNSGRDVGNPHDGISFDTEGASDDWPIVVTTDVGSAPVNAGPIDLSWRMEDGYTFFGTFINPKLGRWEKTQRWQYRSAGLQRLPGGKEGWASKPAGINVPIPRQTYDSESWVTNEIRSPNGKMITAKKIISSNLRRPDSSFESFQIILTSGSETKVLVPETRPYAAQTSILGWAPDSKQILFLYVTPRETRYQTVSLGGRVETRMVYPDLLAQPCTYPRKCRLMSADGKLALLTHSTNLRPDELVLANLRTGALKVLEPAASNFVKAKKPDVSFVPVENTGGDCWGRLYLPTSKDPHQPYPLLITQYNSSPGFAESVGDEIPIPLLTQSGIAVFDMNSGALDQDGIGGDFQAQISRVQRPLRGMQWVVTELSRRGIIDQRRVGIAGLSYGAEIAIYAYWNWTGLRAVSVATGTWEPATYSLAGPLYTHVLNERGLPLPDESSFEKWRRLSVGLNARSDLPPLLIQSPAGEVAGAVAPTWSSLRQAGAPVEWFDYPSEGHVKIHPANKWWVYERNLDWFRFWLKGDVSPEPRKAAQYQRWEAMQSDDRTPSAQETVSRRDPH
jgi:hypothetical protein